MPLNSGLFVNRIDELGHLDDLLGDVPSPGLVLEALDGFGKSATLEVLSERCKKLGLEVILLELGIEGAPDHRIILRNLIRVWGDLLPRTTQALNQFKDEIAPIEKLAGGPLIISGNAVVNVAGDYIQGSKVYAETLRQGEYYGWTDRLRDAFVADLDALAQAEGKTGAEHKVFILLLDDADLATEETCAWVAEMMRGMYQARFPMLRLVLTCRQMPAKLARAGHDRWQSIPLGPLKLEHITELWRKVGLPEQDAAFAFKYSGGKPADLVQMIKTAQQAH